MFYDRHHELFNRYEMFLSQMTSNMFFCVLIKSSPRSSLMTGYLKGVTSRVSLMKHELLTLSEHMDSLPVFSWIRVA